MKRQSVTFEKNVKTVSPCKFFRKMNHCEEDANKTAHLFISNSPQRASPNRKHQTVFVFFWRSKLYRLYFIENSFFVSVLERIKLIITEENGMWFEILFSPYIKYEGTTHEQLWLLWPWKIVTTSFKTSRKIPFSSWNIFKDSSSIKFSKNSQNKHLTKYETDNYVFF